MNNENKILVVLIGAAVLIPSLFAVNLAWPVWLWLSVLAAALVLAMLVRRYVHDRLEQAQRIREFDARSLLREDSEPEPESEPEPNRHQIPNVALPSAVRDYRFVFSTTVRWRSTFSGVGVPYANPRAVVDELVISQARDSVAEESPDNVDLARHRVNAALSGWLQDRSGHVTAYAEDVSLRLPDEDAKRLYRLSEVRKDEEVWEHERNYERNKRAYLSSDVLKSTGSALVWLLAQKDQDHEPTQRRVSDAVALIGKLARITAVVNDTVVPADLAAYLDTADEPSATGSREPDVQLVAESSNGHLPYSYFDGATHPTYFQYGAVSQSTVGEHLAAAVRKYTADEGMRSLLVDRLAKVMGASGGEDIAATLQREFEPSSVPADPSASDDPATPADPSALENEAGVDEPAESSRTAEEPPMRPERPEGARGDTF